MFEIPLPPNSSNYDGMYLVRFVSELAHQQMFMDGKIFFNTSDYFMNSEVEDQGDSLQGIHRIVRPTEAQLVSANIEIYDGKGWMVARDYTAEPQNFPGPQIISYSPAENRRRKLVCFYSMLVDSKRETIAPFDERMRDVFGKYAILITDVNEFVNRVITPLTRDPNMSGVIFGYVNYRNPETLSGYAEWTPFSKIAKDSYQKEFRISFINKDEGVYTLNLLRGLEDIAHPMNADELYSELYIKDGRLYFPPF